ncbi:MAG: methyl-accepting chemotaxis protein [Spirochaetaceae bacterium]
MKKYLIITIVLIINIISIFIIGLKELLPYINSLFLIFLIIYNIFAAKKTTISTDNVETPQIKIDTTEEIKTADDTNKKYEDKIISCNDHIRSLSKKFFYLQSSIPIIEALSKSTQTFEEETLKKVFDQFEEIWKENEHVIFDSEKSMESVFDSNGSDNLGYILNSSKEINKDFSNFIPTLESMSKLTENFVNVSMESFNTISKTTKDIEDLAEQVKVISINVRIEAARIKDSGGFKVLGSDITKFADKTTLFAKSTNEKIQHTLNTIEALKQELTHKLSDVTLSVNNMYKKIKPFEGILDKSTVSLRGVINNLHDVSGHLNNNLKQSLGNLQYQDVTSQEAGHIVDFLKYIEVQLTDSGNVGKPLDDIEKDSIKKEILEFLQKITTTGNEDSQLEVFGEKWDIKYKEKSKENFNSIDEGSFLF